MKYILHMQRVVPPLTRVTLHAFASLASQAAYKYLEHDEGTHVSGSHFDPVSTVNWLVSKHPEWEIHIFACEVERGEGKQII